jgi:hypothetical protein
LLCCFAIAALLIRLALNLALALTDSVRNPLHNEARGVAPLAPPKVEQPPFVFIRKPESEVCVPLKCPWPFHTSDIRAILFYIIKHYFTLFCNVYPKCGRIINLHKNKFLQMGVHRYAVRMPARKTEAETGDERGLVRMALTPAANRAMNRVLDLNNGGGKSAFAESLIEWFAAAPTSMQQIIAGPAVPTELQEQFLEKAIEYLRDVIAKGGMAGIRAEQRRMAAEIEGAMAEGKTKGTRAGSKLAAHTPGKSR